MEQLKHTLESLLDGGDEIIKKSDDAIKFEKLYTELTTKYPHAVLYNDSPRFPVEKDDITLDGKLIIVPDSTIVDFATTSKVFKKYKMGTHKHLIIKYFKGKISELPITKVKELTFEACSLEFDSVLNCEKVDLRECNINNLTNFANQPWKVLGLDAETKHSIANNYLKTLAPNAAFYNWV